METKHTPTPWKSNSMEIFTDAGKTSKRIAFATGYAQGDQNTLDEIRANAAFIVKAVNMHDELVEALQEWLDEADRLGIGKCKGWEKARAILEKAK